MARPVHEQLGAYPSHEIPSKLGGVGKMCSFGEGVSMTPLQLGSLVTAMANGGTMYYLQHPTTAAEVANFQPIVKRHLEIAGLIPELSDGMAGAVNYGTARRLLVTGPVTRNMELALKKTYDATPDPRLVVAVGACGCSGGIFGMNYATRGPVDAVIPVDIYIPGCPPNPYALLHGILLAMGKLDHHAAAGAPRPHFRSIAFGIHM